ncbi:MULTISPECIES: hypothetical protein [Pirellulaceae]|uniref:hypothetical protein n=1 Tax=Pirellulaceae TaxID=2691357 RepID=UPI001304FA42|nr:MULTISPECIES: hypothetical protein [Pirellulaceae]
MQRKNRWAPTRRGPLVRREQPGRGHKHYICKSDVLKFIDLLPQWEELSVGLNEIILAEAREFTQGWYRPGKVAICAWEKELLHEQYGCDFLDHEAVYRRLGIPFDHRESIKYPNSDAYYVHYDNQSLRAYLLLHIFLHELGHHHDLITTKHQDDCARGESYAEDYAIKYETLIFDRYCEAFDYHREPIAH